MVFRKNSILFYEGQFCCSAMVILSMILIPSALGFWYAILSVTPLIFVIILNFWSFNEYIKIDEIGISCQRSGKNLWEYKWEDISELRKGSRFRLPSIDIISFDRHGKPEQYAVCGHYFQLCKTAKKAIKQYYKPPNEPQPKT